MARALSKLGYCSRSEAFDWIREGRVRVNGRVCVDPLQFIDLHAARIEVDGAPAQEKKPVYLVVNKPRGLVTTRADEKGRDTVYTCLAGAGLPWVGPVGRLDQASEGLLLFSNDNAWSARITDPASRVRKVYDVQIGRLADDALCRQLEQGLTVDGEVLKADQATVLRSGEKHSWLQLVLTEGKNRHIRRLLAAFEVEVLRLVRVAIGCIRLGDLAKGKWRHLTLSEIAGVLAPHDRPQVHKPSGPSL